MLLCSVYQHAVISSTRIFIDPNSKNRLYGQFVYGEKEPLPDNYIAAPDMDTVA